VRYSVTESGNIRAQLRVVPTFDAWLEEPEETSRSAATRASRSGPAASRVATTGPAGAVSVKSITHQGASARSRAASAFTTPEAGAASTTCESLGVSSSAVLSCSEIRPALRGSVPYQGATSSLMCTASAHAIRTAASATPSVVRQRRPQKTGRRRPLGPLSPKAGSGEAENRCLFRPVGLAS
jgi:hypothetical protein